MSTEVAAKPSLKDRIIAKYSWIDHLVRAGARYKGTKGDFLAAGTTYFSILAVFPLLMVVAAAAGYILAENNSLLVELEQKIHESVTGAMGEQLISLLNQAIDSRTTLGVIGLAGATFTGLGWMGNLRLALTAQWGNEPPELGFIKRYAVDVLALLSLGFALLVSVGLTVVGGSKVTDIISAALASSGANTETESAAFTLLIRVTSFGVSLLVSAGLFSWAIAKLPRVALPLRNSIKAGILAAIAFEIFKQLAAVYLKGVLTGPAGATFGPILGIMVFLYITNRIILFCTAWAATDLINRKYEVAVVPAPVVISPRLVAEPKFPLGPRALFIAGLVAGVGVSWNVFKHRLRKNYRGKL